ncbi:methyltransferase [Penicillium concentricum]|uniref:Methyltransferase n=1 Tax=Penicillium concentricum TaxID=293559 RepID=A0A9W9S8U0_9EURO|nr:methyltransferase [Penicillium concentricum]KAJ5374103.1 methyltransferase [Penicillium concentricum]
MRSIEDTTLDTVHTTLAFRLDPALGGCDLHEVGNPQIPKRDIQDSEVLDLDLQDDEAVSSKYYEEVSSLVKTMTGASFAHCYMHFLRASNYASRPTPDNFIIPPAHVLHVDYSYNDAPDYISTLPEQPPDWERLARSRWAIFSCWRPVTKVTRDALCLGDKRTIPDSDLIDGSTDMPVHGRQRRTGLFTVNHNPAHRYYYKKEMGPEDVLWIKLYDSKTDGRARCSPHSAFTTASDYGEARQSIETRCIVVWEDESLH